MASSSHPFLNPIRIVAWTGAAALILAPLVAMRFTREVNWTASDFAIAIAIVGGSGLVLELAIRTSRNLAYRAGCALAIGTAFLLIWGNLAVGVIGTEDNPVNLMFFAVPVIGFVAAMIGGLRPRGMVAAMVITAASQLAAALIAYLQGWGSEWPLMAVFTLLWLLAAGLFGKAARGERAA